MIVPFSMAVSMEKRVFPGTCRSDSSQPGAHAITSSCFLNFSRRLADRRGRRDSTRASADRWRSDRRVCRDGRIDTGTRGG